MELPPEVSSQEWHFEGDPAKLAVELLAAFLVGRNEHAEAGMTAAARNGHDFTIAYAWAMGVAVLANPDGELASARQSFRVPTIAVEGSAANSIVAGYAGMVAAAANRNAAAAQEMWRGMSIAEQQWVVSNLLHNLRHGFARALQM